MSNPDIKKNKFANIDWSDFEQNKCQIQIHDLAAFAAELKKLRDEFTDEYFLKNYPALYELSGILKRLPKQITPCN